MTKRRMADLKRAHRLSSNHKPNLEKDQVCGCYYCMKIYHPSRIKEWVIANTPIDWRGTALCPYCGIDSVIGESSGFPITPEFLKAMHRYWFRPVRVKRKQNQRKNI